ncbi:MAG TPA: J domain-containing protein [Oligoflexus sp.]|uniref:J domain-containing protein n=1 Tax=Oligoflexus sp. TaxID=1971216 RepID=UPI002D8020F0|nr:J domain-containing protein [Oligoflexus sp.]HET9241300.1 J domain-containing protein [Oligoflexus sp.]
MLTALLRWMDPDQLFAVLLDQKPEGPRSDLPLARPPAIPDQVLLKKLIPADLYRDAMQAGWMGMHALSFALRYRVTELQLLFHLNHADVDHGLRQELLDSWQHMQGLESLPIFGFSPLGIHVSARPRGICRAFDAISLWSCHESTAGIFCAAHAAEAFWIPAAAASQQAIMFRYYADLQNFSLYGEADLEQMMGAFWKRYEAYAAEDMGAALEYFGFQEAKDLRALGATELRRKFLQLSMVHHPDRGGAEENFVRLQRHYQRLKLYLEAL